MAKQLGTAALFVLACFSPRMTAAQSVCQLGERTVLPPDGRIFTFTAQPTTTYGFKTDTNGPPFPARSYSVEVNGLDDAYFHTPALYVRDLADCTEAHLGVAVRDTKQIEPRLASEIDNEANRRFSFTTTEHAVWFVLRNSYAFAMPYTISAAETTMFSPAWSTNGKYATYYSIFNNTSAAIEVTLTLTTNAGTTVGTTTVSIPAFRNASTNTTALGVAAGQTGVARITHDGPPGALTVEADIANFTFVPAFIQPVKFEAPRQVR